MQIITDELLTFLSEQVDQCRWWGYGSRFLSNPFQTRLQEGNSIGHSGNYLHHGTRQGKCFAVVAAGHARVFIVVFYEFCRLTGGIQ